jgi:hypothetical protein
MVARRPPTPANSHRNGAEALRSTAARRVGPLLRIRTITQSPNSICYWMKIGARSPSAKRHGVRRQGRSRRSGLFPSGAIRTRSRKYESAVARRISPRCTRSAGFLCVVVTAVTRVACYVLGNNLSDAPFIASSMVEMIDVAAMYSG